MCEPNLSIVQVYNPAEQQNRNNLLIGKSLNFEWRKDIGVFTHLTKMGAGHHVIYPANNLNRYTFYGGGIDSKSITTDFETSWWDRKVEADGFYGCPQYLVEDSLSAAQKYSNLVCIGSLHSLRQFLDLSLQKTERFSKYSCIFPEMLNEKGKKEYEFKLRKIPNIYLVDQCSFSVDSGRLLAKIKKARTEIDLAKKSVSRLILGMTRKREFLVPEWADDDSLWGKKEREVMCK